MNVAQINAAYIAANGVTPGVNPLALSFLGDKATQHDIDEKVLLVRKLPWSEIYHE